MSEEIDPRRGVPSASAIARIEQCPASHQMALLAGNNSGKWSRFGDEIHAALATDDPSKLDPAQLETFEMCKEQAEWVLADWLAQGSDGTHSIYRDSMRLGLTSIGGVVEVKEDTSAAIVFTGRADVIAIKTFEGQKSFLIIDYKTLRGDVPEAADNPQLRALAVLVANRFRCESGRVAIIQPWAGKPTLADFDSVALGRSSVWLRLVLDRESKSLPADRRAGQWCRYCPANDRCEVFRDKALAPVEEVALTLPGDPETARAALFARAMDLPAKALAGAVRGLKLIGWYAAAIEGAAKLRAADDVEFQQFYRLKDGSSVREITDAQAAWALAESQGVSYPDFLASVKVTISNLESAIRQASGPKITASGKPHKTQFALSAEAASKLIDSLEATGAMTRKQSAPQLEAVTLV